jgi:hypothetical protein
MRFPSLLLPLERQAKEERTSTNVLAGGDREDLGVPPPVGKRQRAKPFAMWPCIQLVVDDFFSLGLEALRCSLGQRRRDLMGLGAWHV